MFDFLRNPGRSEEMKQQEMLSAYLDNELTPADRARVEQQLALDSDLQDELAEVQFWQQQMRNLPARRVPRNFTLDPALYGRPQRQFLAGAYPMLRAATAVTALLFVIALVTNLYIGEMVAEPLMDTAAAPMMEIVVESEADDGMESDMEMAAEAPAETFMLEETDELEAAEAPVELVEPEAAAAESTEGEELSIEEEALGEAALPTDQALPLPPALEMVEGTPPAATARDSAAAPMDQPKEALPEEAAAPPRPLATAVPEPPMEAVEEPLPATPLSLADSLGPIALGLGLLFVGLAVLTLIARARK